MSGLTQRELESYLWGAATLLRGLVDASDYKQYIFPLMFFKRLSDVWDEDYKEALEETGDKGYAMSTANDRFTAGNFSFLRLPGFQLLRKLIFDELLDHVRRGMRVRRHVERPRLCCCARRELSQLCQPLRVESAFAHRRVVCLGMRVRV
jgi:hypothetical protein